MTIKKTLTRRFFETPGNLKEFFKMAEENRENINCELKEYSDFMDIGIGRFDEEGSEMIYKTPSGLCYKDQKEKKANVSDFERREFLVNRMEEYSKMFPKVGISYVVPSTQ